MTSVTVSPHAARDLAAMNATIVALLVLLVNLPFGYWRASVPTRSRQWFLAIHLPIPFVIALRIASDIGFELWTYPLIVGAFAAGQALGGIAHRVRVHRASDHVELAE
jgi:Kef-type K+ transport system membrane component KefB